MKVEVGPLVVKAIAGEYRLNERQSIGRIGSHPVCFGIIARFIFFTVLDKKNIMPHQVEPEHILKMMPHQPAQGATDNITKDCYFNGIWLLRFIKEMVYSGDFGSPAHITRLKFPDDPARVAGEY